MTYRSYLFPIALLSLALCGMLLCDSAEQFPAWSSLGPKPAVEGKAGPARLEPRLQAIAQVAAHPYRVRERLAQK